MIEYDVIGDIHGRANEFEAILLKMGYQPKGLGFSHPTRKLIMVGDLIDGDGKSGPDAQRRVVQIAKTMISSGDAEASMGNHEFNAICYATRMSNGSYVRPRDDKNKRQHKAFLDAFEVDSKGYLEAIEFFKSLPLFIEKEGFRVIHAYWSTSVMDRLLPYLDENRRVVDFNTLLDLFGTKSEPLYSDLETALKGPEVDTPKETHVIDHYGLKRTTSRVKWWSESRNPIDWVMLKPSLQEQNLEKMASCYDLAEQYLVRNPPKTTFFGHYWQSPQSFPATEASGKNVCLDYSVSGKGGLLVAARTKHDSKQIELISVNRED